MIEPKIVSCQIQDDVAIITLDDGKANALSHNMLRQLDAALDEAEMEAKAIIIAGRPGRFSAGLDLRVMQASTEDMRELVKASALVMLRVFMFPRPVVVACTGHAMAGGAVMLLASDLSIGITGDFKIGLNEVSIGMPLPVFVVELARARLDPRHFMTATGLAQVYGPKGAQEVGFLHRAVSPQDLEATCIKSARRLAKLSPPAFELTRENARGATEALVRETLEEDLLKLELTP